MKVLYKKIKTKLQTPPPTGLIVETFTPKIWRGLTVPGERKSVKILAVRVLYQIITRGKAKIYYVCYDGALAHTSYVIPKCYKFPFLKKNDYEIGPCFTYPAYRGRSIYPAMLRHICQSVGAKGSTFYMIVDEDNISSIRGIEKAGFNRCGKIKKTKILKKYQIQ